MKFVHPRWIIGILGVLLIFFWILWDEKKRVQRLEQFAHLPLLFRMSPEMDLKARFRKSVLFLLSISFIFLALARPQWGAHEEIVKTSSLDLVILLDVSRSMDVADVVPTRLQKAKHFVRSLLSHVQGDRVGLIGFAESSYVASPLTSDTDYILDMLEVLDSNSVQSQGTDVSSALEVALSALERGAQESGKGAQQQLPSRVIVLISDGEDHQGSLNKVASLLKESGVKLYVLGVGTEKGGPIPLRNPSGDIQGYKGDLKGQVVISQFHPETLSELAQRAEGRYWNMSPSESEVDALWSEINSLVRGDYEQRKYIIYEERFQVPLFLAIVLLLLEMSLSARRTSSSLTNPSASLSSSSTTPSSSLSSSSIGMRSLILYFCLTSFLQGVGSQVYAAPPSASSLDLYLKNKRGLKSFEAGQLEDAQKEFGAAQARDPGRPEPEFNQGVVQLQQNQVDQAIESFKNASRLAESDPRFSIRGKSMVNLGKAYSKKGEYKEAIQSYRQAIEEAQRTQDAPLEAMARKSLELLLKEKQQKQQQNQQQKKDDQNEQKNSEQDQKKSESSEQKKEEKNQENQSSTEQNQKQDQQMNKNGEKDQKSESQGASQTPDLKKSSGEQDKKHSEQEERNSGQIFQPNPKQNFESQKMTVDDANRVMDELRIRERELQEKLQKKNAKSQDHSKDW